MPAEFDLGDNYSIDEDSNGDLVIKDGNGNTVLKHNNGTGKLTAPSQSVNSSSDVAVKDYVDSVAQGLDWQDSVIDEQNDPPGSPNTGDRYLVDDTPTGDWSGQPNDIAEWDGSQWVFFDPNEGWAVFLEDVDLLKVYDSGQSDWIAFGSAIDHGALAGLADDDHSQYLLVDGTRAMSGGLDMGSNAISNASSVSTKAVDNNQGRRLYAGNYSGADADARLDEALAAAETGDTIILEATNYASRTISGARVTIIGTAVAFGDTEITDWTIDSTARLSGVDVSGTLTLNGNESAVKDGFVSSGDAISVAADRVVLGFVRGGGSVTFESGTSNGEIGLTSGNLSITDNGSNSVL